MRIPEIKRSFILTKKINGEEIVRALESISHCYGEYTQRLVSDVDGKRTYDIGILKDSKYPQTGLIVGVENIRSIGAMRLNQGVIFDKKYHSGDRVIVTNYLWLDRVEQHYDQYEEKEVIKAVESLRNSLAIKLCG